jgi:predicted AAA+ superfamily ATPase
MRELISKKITQDLKDKMVLLGGPRQVGKTTLAVSYLPLRTKKDPGYLNWDLKLDRQRIQSEQLPLTQPLLVLDELYKYQLVCCNPGSSLTYF